MSVENCSDCDYASDGPLASDGRCSECHGTGYTTDVIDALAKSLGGQSQKCETCEGSGKCQTCYGKGYLVT